MTAAVELLFARPWIWSFLGAGVGLARGRRVHGRLGAGGMITAAFSLAVFTVIVGVGQMFVITLGPATSICRCPPISDLRAPWR